MIIIAQIGGPNGIRMCFDTDDTEHVPTPEWCEDMAHRLGRQAVAVYQQLPDAEPVEPESVEPDMPADPDA